jgi:hypothetical protein
MGLYAARLVSGLVLADTPTWFNSFIRIASIQIIFALQFLYRPQHPPDELDRPATEPTGMESKFWSVTGGKVSPAPECFD